MNKIFSTFLVAALGTSLLTSCIEEEQPQNGYPSLNQVANAPGSFDNLVANLTSNLCGKRLYGPDKTNWTPRDYGYPTLFLTRDVEGQDIVPAGFLIWYYSWFFNVFDFFC